jgi:hypothetical protein
MNTNTGIIYDKLPGETTEQLAARLNSSGVFGKASDYVPVARHPDGTCKKCKGTGAVKRGLFSKRFKPCECVL